MVWVKVLAAGVVSDGAEGFFASGAVIELPDATAAALVEAGWAEGADAPSASAPARSKRQPPPRLEGDEA
jgi:hypothetical protein